MFNQNQKRIGFACKIQSELGKAHKDLNTKSTTITYLRGLDKDAAYAKLYGIVYFTDFLLLVFHSFCLQDRGQSDNYGVNSFVTIWYDVSVVATITVTVCIFIELFG